MPSRPPDVFVTTKQGKTKQSGETLFSAVCMSIRRCHTKNVIFSQIPLFKQISQQNDSLKNTCVLELLDSEDVLSWKIMKSLHGASFVLWLLR